MAGLLPPDRPTGQVVSCAEAHLVRCDDGGGAAGGRLELPVEVGRADAGVGLRARDDQAPDFGGGQHLLQLSPLGGVALVLVDEGLGLGATSSGTYSHPAVPGTRPSSECWTPTTGTPWARAELPMVAMTVSRWCAAAITMF